MEIAGKIKVRSILSRIINSSFVTQWN